MIMEYVTLLVITALLLIPCILLFYWMSRDKPAITISQEHPDTGYYNSKFDELQTSVDNLNSHLLLKEEELNKQLMIVAGLELKLQEALDRNSVVVSQKTSHAVRTADMIENVVPLLPNLPYNSKDMHHLGKPVDFIFFNYENKEIVFVEVKTGKAKETQRQKQIRKSIQEGKVFYELLTISDKGITTKRIENNV
jgi:predicted Holliday junction resolvase-like endonuclease